MMRRIGAGLGLIASLSVGALLTGCALEETSSGVAEQEIVRGVPEAGRAYVVALLVEKADNTSILCSGTLIAPRVVLTAAHCIPSTPIRRILAYYGSSYAADLASFSVLPPPGKPSVWAQAENWDKHPAYDPSLIFPDLAVVYLDRVLPIAPLAIESRRITLKDFGKLATIVGWGANKALSEDIQVTSGAGEKRSGVVPFLGSPLAFPKPEDPHPGLVNAKVRQGLAMVGGFAPFSNGCAGDSGGPAIMRIQGQDRLIGVASWTGNWCEDYSYYTRLDEQSAFLKQSLALAGNAAVIPTLDCVSENTNGTLRAHLGYRNQNKVSVTLPLGAANVMAVDTQGFRPSVFRAGEQHYAAAVDFPKQGQLIWKLASGSAGSKALTVNNLSPRCDANLPEVLVSQACAAGDGLKCGQAHQDCVAANLDSYAMAPDCSGEMDTLMRCQAGASLDAFSCFNDMAFLSGACMDESDAWFFCAFPM